MKSLIMIILLIISLNVFSQNQSKIDEIENYMATLSHDKIDSYKVQRDDETHSIKVYRKGGGILWIEGEGSGEFISFKYAFYFKKDKLVHSEYYLSTLKGHWSEFIDKKPEYHERQEYIYYFNDEPIQARGYDSDMENNVDEAIDENGNGDEDDSYSKIDNQIGCIDMAYEFLKTYSK